MALTVKHNFFSAKADGGDTTIVRPSDWNANHVITMGANTLIGNSQISTGVAEEIQIGGGLKFNPTTKTLDTSNVGAVEWWPTNVAPSGRLKLNGALLSRTTYAALYAFALASGNMAASDAVWTSSSLFGQFSPGDGTTTFRIPDLRGYHLRAWDDGRGVDIARAIGTYQADDNALHAHTITQTAHAHGISDPGHAHGVGDPGHLHVLNGYGDIYGGTSDTGGRRQVQGTGAVAVDTRGTGIWIGGAGTGIGIVGGNANITINNAGGDGRPKNLAFLATIRY